MSIFVKPQRQINRVFIHCSASNNPDHDDVSVIRQWHKEKGWNDVGYHFFIQHDGNIQLGRDIEITPAAQSGNNAHTIAICLSGLDNFIQSQFDSLKDLCRDINKRIPDATFHGHREVANKSCPNFAYKTVLGLDDKGNLGGICT